MSTREKRIDYIEFPAKDIPAVKAFYSAIFGWQFVDYGSEYASFTLESAGIAGGFFLSDGPAAGLPYVILHVDDLSAAEAAVTSAGGTIVKPVFSFPGGRRFHFTDPSGNELAVWHDDEADSNAGSGGESPSDTGAAAANSAGDEAMG